MALAKTNKTYILSSWPRRGANFEVGTATITDTARRSRAPTRPRRRRSPPRTTCSTGASRWSTWWAAAMSSRLPLAHAGGAVPSVRPANVEEWVTVADTVHPQAAGARRARGRPAEIDNAGQLPTIDAVASVSANHANAIRSFRHHAALHRRGAELAAVHRRRGAKPHQGNGVVGAALARGIQNARRTRRRRTRAPTSACSRARRGQVRWKPSRRAGCRWRPRSWAG